MSNTLLDKTRSEVTKEDLPAYYWPALKIPALFQSIKQQYDLGYGKNPLPTQFKEQLIVYLSQKHNLAYGVVCHSCQLYNLGVSGQEVLRLLQLPYPEKLEELTFHHHYLEKVTDNQLTFSDDFSVTLYLLPYCWLMLHAPHDHQLKKMLCFYLGDYFYGHLVSFIGYIKSYHYWLKSYPSIDYREDFRSRLYLKQLLTDEPQIKEYICFEKSKNQLTTQDEKTQGCPPKVTINSETLEVEFSLMESSLETLPNFIYLTTKQGKKLKYVTHNLFKQLYEKNKLLIQKNQSLQAFSYSLSHDLGAPLRAIEGFSQALERQYQDYFDEKANHYLRRIQANGKQMKQLIEDILRLTQIDHRILRKASVNLSELANTICDSLKEQDQNRSVIIEIEPNLIVKGDSGLLKIMMENLIRNAWKYTAYQSLAQIKIGFNNDHKAFFIEDNGVGFDMTDSHRLFQAFQRIHSSKAFQGNGIGLATVHRIINCHGGKIWAESVIDQGATFYFKI
ncbi:MAG: ATP-binding protein [Microcystaceae cyanobacterium]